VDLAQQHTAVFESLGRLGLRTAIDDFGTGYSSLKYLTHYPVTRLKIAQDLVSCVDSDARNATVVRTAIRLAQELGLDFVAEGIETETQQSSRPIPGYRHVRFLALGDGTQGRCRIGRVGRTPRSSTSVLATTRMISIVDDDAAVREATEALVRSLGHSAATFSSAEEFLNSDRLQETSCLITDVQMAGMTGIELQRRLSAAGRHCPVIVVTGSPDEGVRARALEAGAIGVLGKPLSDEMLIASLDVALAR
jgi:CheY-like chemotaxis protein